VVIMVAQKPIGWLIELTAVVTVRDVVGLSF
jgi:hypothetical protein